jgi:hypothetical protein
MFELVYPPGSRNGMLTSSEGLLGISFGDFGVGGGELMSSEQREMEQCQWRGATCRGGGDFSCVVSSQWYMTRK